MEDLAQACQDLVYCYKSPCGAWTEVKGHRDQKWGQEGIGVSRLARWDLGPTGDGGPV